MDLGSLLKGAMPLLAPNGTGFGAWTSNQSAQYGRNGILGSLAPLLGGQFNPLLRTFMVVYELLGSQLGLDPTILLTFFGIFWAVNRVYGQLYRYIATLVTGYLMANVHISGNDEMYLHLMKFLALQPAMVNSRSISAETVSKTAWEGEEESDVLATRISADGSGVYLDFSGQEAKALPRFTPAVGNHGFWFRRRYFRISRMRESFLEDSGRGTQTFKDRENLVVSCFGRSPEPVKQLLQHCKQQYYNSHYAQTIVRRPGPQSTRRYAGRGNWMQVANRPVRPMTTVVLDAKQKLQLLADINEYLHPATARWYANRGIPLRRGYLFHGPPGTGKTSLSFALAGVFGLDIYVISLLEPTLTEEDVGVLFNSLPRRCVVLLEDIDTAGLTRADASAGKEPGKDGAAPINEWKVTDLAKALKDNKPNSENNGISLSGLLNAIDGVASHEGRVLIMTTNKPETLDEALLRPGRVDLQVAFTNATKTQAKELFERMYEADQKPLRRRQDQMQQAGHAKVKEVAEKEKAANGHANGHTENAINGITETKKPVEDTEPHTTADIQDDERLDISREELSEIAAEFAHKIPDGAFSPAEIQGFLLKRKKLPRKALAEVEHWVEGMLESKASKARVLQVQ